MDLNDVFRQRQSVRNFTNQPIEQNKIEALKEALRFAPSSKAKFPCQFYFVKDPVIISQLAQSKPHGATFLEKAPFAIVFAADPEISDVWIEDTSIAATYAMLQVTNLGLGSCWVQIRNRFYNEQTTSEDFIRNLLQIEYNMRITSLLAVGYPAENINGGQKNIYANINHVG